MNLEKNVKIAFNGVKKDILEIKEQLTKLTEKQEKFEALFDELDKKKAKSISEDTRNNNQAQDSLVQIGESPKKTAKKVTKKKTKKNSKKK